MMTAIERAGTTIALGLCLGWVAWGVLALCFDADAGLLPWSLVSGVLVAQAFCCGKEQS